MASKPSIIVPKENPLLQTGDVFQPRVMLWLHRHLAPKEKIWRAGTEKLVNWEEYPQYPDEPKDSKCPSCGAVLKDAPFYQTSQIGPAEDFIVIKTEMTGGSTGRDSYPDGHQVTAQSLRDENFQIQFYQTGSFVISVMVLPRHVKKTGKRTVETKLVIS